MPGWHDALREFTTPSADGTAAPLQTIGIVEEQHPDRARLFMQWKQMDWPVMADPLNQLGVDVVPITLLIDEHGVVRQRVRRPDAGVVRAFLEAEFPAPDAVPSPSEPLDWPGLLVGAREAEGSPVTAAGIDARACLMYHGNFARDEPVAEFVRAVEMASRHAAYHFHLGVAYRRRFESAAQRTGDFQAAVDAWQRALDLNPNQYIWRRRIQQYGPRLIKPYPFYDWVSAARADITARGDVPARLELEPSGAEIAAPERTFAPVTKAAGGDPDGRITHDTELVDTTVTVVPGVVEPGDAVRLHVHFDLRRGTVGGHWNNEGEPMQVWLETGADFEAAAVSVVVANARSATSREPRRAEFELRIRDDGPPGEHIVHGYALANLCRGADGQCVYRRIDFEAVVHVRE